MADPLQIVVVVDPVKYLAGDVLQLEVTSPPEDGGAAVVLPDRLVVRAQRSERLGFGYGSVLQAGFGFGVNLPWGDGAWGHGHALGGQRTLTLTTNQVFAAGDYTVRVRAVDEAGNVGAWGEAFVVKHRPRPSGVAGLAVSGDELVFSY